MIILKQYIFFLTASFLLYRELLNVCDGQSRQLFSIQYLVFRFFLNFKTNLMKYFSVYMSKKILKI